MAYTEEVKVLGDDTVYKLNPSLKKYTLMDLGFTLRKNGTYRLIRLLDTTSTHKQGIKLKIVIKSDFKNFKISTVTMNEMQGINIFKNDNFKSVREQYWFTIENLITRGILIRK